MLNAIRESSIYQSIEAKLFPPSYERDGYGFSEIKPADITQASKVESTPRKATVLKGQEKGWFASILAYFFPPKEESVVTQMGDGWSSEETKTQNGQTQFKIYQNGVLQQTDILGI